MSKYIKTWKELSQISSTDNKYKIVLEEDGYCGWIVPVKETEETKTDYFKHHVYLSTHTFYGPTSYKESTNLLQKYGFDVELANWG